MAMPANSVPQVEQDFYESLESFEAYRQYAPAGGAPAVGEDPKVGTLPEFFAPQPVPVAFTQLR